MNYFLVLNQQVRRNWSEAYTKQISETDALGQVETSKNQQKNSNMEAK